ncbi:MAG: PorV/PorQ family protein [candidate division KSB1 bacterium]|nr:PorV/PorQ family protein [candidate division KSB1 bacterium]MDZ7365127.1 PorV/PorQ family protein [candidate division KSB1 bacterium]MDZ7404337.1 PorV/PorQ family protein [candidate division KSB1 bacterium]
MNRKNFSIFILPLFLAMGFSWTSALAQSVTKVGTSAAAFLRIPVGSKGTSMGSAFVSIADDATAMFWNPGGMARLTNKSLYVDHSPWLPGLDFNYFALALPFEGAGTIGLNVTALTTSEMIRTTIDQPMGTGETFTASSIAVGVAYAYNLTDRFSIGANFKYINEKILNSNATGFAIDIGTLYTTPFDGIRLGVSISNFGNSMRIDGEDLNVRVDIAPNQRGNNQSVVGRLKTNQHDSPLIMRVGVSWEALKSQQNRLTVAVDGLNPNDNSQSVNLGAELGLFKELLVLRGGFNDLFLEDREKGFTFGGGVNLGIEGGLKFSGGYAYQDFEHLGGVNRFSIALNF